MKLGFFAANYAHLSLEEVAKIMSCLLYTSNRLRKPCGLEGRLRRPSGQDRTNVPA